MKILSAPTHGILDYALVVLFALLPSVFGLTGLPAIVLYVFAGAHLLVSLLTRYPLGALKRLPFNAHGLLELTVAVVLVALPWLLDFADEATARSVFIGMGVLVFVLWLLSDYTPSRISTEADNKTSIPPPATPT